MGTAEGGAGGGRGVVENLLKNFADFENYAIYLKQGITNKNYSGFARELEKTIDTHHRGVFNYKHLTTGLSTMGNDGTNELIKTAH